MKGAVVLLACLAGCATRPAGPSLARDWVGVDGAEGGGGELRLDCEPADAEVYLDGVGQGTCLDFSGARRGLGVRAGLHRVEVKKRGFVPYQTYYEPSGASASLAPTLRPVAGSQGESR